MTRKITCANLVAGLGDEGESWKIQIAHFQEEQTSFEALLSTAFVSYSCFFIGAIRGKTR